MAAIDAEDAAAADAAADAAASLARAPGIRLGDSHEAANVTCAVAAALVVPDPPVNQVVPNQVADEDEIEFLESESRINQYNTVRTQSIIEPPPNRSQGI